MAGSGARTLVATMVVCLLLVAAPHAVSALTCGQFYSYSSPCINYVRGMGPLPSTCCNGIKTATRLVMTPVDRQTACNCLNSLTKQIPGVKPNLLSGLPAQCGTTTPFPLGISIDCSKVH